jgi:pimeloyl-ACP methyl ester carboxylesterase
VSVASCGHEPASGLYWERLGGEGGGTARLLIHGGGASGSCWRATPDGRAGWADLLAAAGERCWVTDWPGCGRSGGCDPATLTYDDLWRGYVALLEDVIAEPVVVVCHSMGGAIAWKLAERVPELVAGVVAVAASYPGNIAPSSEVVGEDDEAFTVRFGASGLDFRVPRDRHYFYDDTYVLGQGISTSSRFPLDCLDGFRASLLGIPPRVIQQRLGLGDGLPRVEDTAAFRGLPVRLLAGTEDPAHSAEIERATGELLASWGADVEVVMLGEQGIEGNGHFLMAESNSDQILREWVAPFPARREPAAGVGVPLAKA